MGTVGMPGPETLSQPPASNERRSFSSPFYLGMEISGGLVAGNRDKDIAKPFVIFSSSKTIRLQ